MKRKITVMTEAKIKTYIEASSDWLMTHFTVFLVMGTVMALLAGLFISERVDKSQNKPVVDTLIVKPLPRRPRIAPVATRQSHAPNATPVTRVNRIDVRRAREGQVKNVSTSTSTSPFADLKSTLKSIKTVPGHIKRSFKASATTTSAAVRTYTVGPGDTLSRIAKKVYGDRRKWPRIARANDDRLGNYRHLKIGTVLVIPSDTIKGGTSDIRQVINNATPKGVAPETKTYTVRKGDTWWAMTKRLLGDPTKWKSLRNQNKHILKGGKLHPGVVLQYTVSSD